MIISYELLTTFLLSLFLCCWSMFLFDFTVCDSLMRATQESSQIMRSNCQEYDCYDDQTPLPDWNLHIFSVVVFSLSHQNLNAEKKIERCLEVVGTVDQKTDDCEERMRNYLWKVTNFINFHRRN